MSFENLHNMLVAESNLLAAEEELATFSKEEIELVLNALGKPYEVRELPQNCKRLFVLWRSGRLSVAALRRRLESHAH